MPLFNHAFLKTVEPSAAPTNSALIAAYKLGTGKLIDDTDKFPIMLKQGQDRVATAHRSRPRHRKANSSRSRDGTGGGGA